MTEDNKSLQDQLRLQKEILSQSKMLGATQEEIETVQQNIKDLGMEILRQRSENLDLSLRERTQARLRYQEAFRSEEQLKKQKEEQLELEKKIKEEMERQEEIANRLNNKIIGFANSWRGGLLETVLETGISFEDLGETMKEAFSVENVAGLAIDTILQSTVKALYSMESAVSSLAAATGTGRAYIGVVSDAARGASSMGVGFEEAAKAVGALDAQLAGFRSMNEGAQTDIAQTVASLESLGIESGVSAKQMDTSMRLLGMTADQAKQSLDDQAAFAIGIGVAPAKMAADFQAAMPQLAAYGSKAEQVFNDLAVKSRGLGIEMSSLLSITKQFDTFEGAAEAAGKLNSILGGGLLDSTELLHASDAERIEILQRSVAASGKSYDAMTKFEKMQIANAAGITDMAEANNMFSESSKKTAAELEEEKISQEKLNEMKREAIPMMKKLELVMMQVAVAIGPLVNFFMDLAEVIMEVNDFFGGYLLPVLVFGVATFAVMVKLLMVGSTLMTGFAAATASAAPAVGALGPAFAAAGAGMAAAAPGFAAAGVAAIKLGLAVILIGLGIGLAAAGLALLVLAFGQLLQIIVNNIAIMPQVILSVYLLALGFQMLGVSMVIAGVGMLVFAQAAMFMAATALVSFPIIIASIFGLAAAMYTLGLATSGIAFLFSAVFGGLAFILSMVFEKITATTDKISETIGALNSFDGGGFVTAIEVVQGVTTEDVDNIASVVDQAERYVQVQAQMKVLGAVDAFANALGGFFPKPGSDASDANKKEVVLKLDDREFARAVTNALDGKMKLNLMGS